MSVFKDSDKNEKKYLLNFAEFQDKRVLEIGCGEGRLTWGYASDSSLTVGMDSDRDALHIASFDRSPKLEQKVHFIHALAEKLPLQKETFDIAVLAWSL